MWWGAWATPPSTIRDETTAPSSISSAAAAEAIAKPPDGGFSRWADRAPRPVAGRSTVTQSDPAKPATSRIGSVSASIQKASDMPVAAKLGFSSPGNMSRFMRDLTALTPREHRRAARARGSVPMRPDDIVY